MSSDAGTVHVDVEPELRGFSQRLGAGVRRAAERADVSIKARIELAERGAASLRAQTQRAARDAGVEIKAEVDASGVQNAVRREVAQAERKGPIKLKVELDRKALLGGGGLLVGALTARELTQFAFGATAIASAVQPAAAALSALAAAAIGATAALSPLVGLMPALAVGASALGQGIGVAAAAFFGIGDTLKAYKQTQDSATKSTTAGASAARAAARAQQSAARQLRDSLADVDEARRSSAEAATEAAARVDDAERDLTRSQESARRAQEALNDARREAKEELEDLQLAVERSALGEEQAQLRLEQARVKLRRVRVLDASSGGKASRELRDATLDVKDAELSVREAAERRGDQQERLNKLTANGVDGSERVISAQDALRDANQRVVDSQRAVMAAGAAVVKTQEQGARRVANALENVERAQEAVSDAAERANEATMTAAGGVDKFAQSMSKLSPAGQSFVRTLLSFEAPLKRLRDVAAENLFPGLERGLEAMRPLFAVFEPIVASTARTLGNLGERLGRLLGSPFFQKAFTTLGNANVRILESLGNAAINLATPITQILIAATPLAEAFARLALRGSEMFATFIDGQEKSGGLARFFDATERSARLLWGVLKPIIETLFGVGRAAKSTGEFVLTGIGGALDELSRKVNSPEGQAGLKNFFESLWPALTEMGRLVVDLAREFGNFAKEGAPKLAPLIQKVREELVPALVSLADKASDVGPKIIDFITKVSDLLAALPIVPIIDVLMRFFDVLILIANSPIGSFLFQLTASLTVVKFAAFALKGTLALFGISIGGWAIAIATAALLIITNWEKVAPVFEWVKNAVVTAVGWLGNYVLAKVEWMVKALAAAFGWLPFGLGDDLRKAAKSVEKFRDDFNKSIAGIVGEKTVKIKLEAFNPKTAGQLESRLVPGRFQSMGRREHGGPVLKDRSYIVGEKRAEVFTPDRDGYILPRVPGTGGDGAAAAPGVTHNHEWNITAVPADDLVTEIPRRLRSVEHLYP